MMSRMVRICVQGNEKLWVLPKIVFQISNGLVFFANKTSLRASVVILSSGAVAADFR